MIVIDYQKKHHLKIIHSCVEALKQGKVVAYPTDTSYGLAVDATNIKAIKKLYKVKERDFKKAVHVVIPSLSYAKKVSHWDNSALKLIKKFWPGPLTLVLKLKIKNYELTKLSAKSGFIGLRMPKNQIALDLVKYLKAPITATSANPSLHLSGGYDSYSAEDVLTQFKNKKFKPDIIINAGKLPRRKPSTILKFTEGEPVILREGPISITQINKVLK